MIKCVNCNSDIPERAKYCPECGSARPVVLCSDCGGENYLDYKYCIHCGHLLFDPSSIISLEQAPVIEWVRIPGGSFYMGSPDSEPERYEWEGPRHMVSVNPFVMSQYCVTFELYDLFCDTIGIKKPDDNGWGRGNRPVVNVSWHEARAFAKWMNCRLPTEAEWEYACRAGTTTPFYTGNNLTTGEANYNGNRPYNGYSKGAFLNKTAPVGSYPSNPWGLYDMHGNVWEWCEDCFDEHFYSQSPQDNPICSVGTLKVVRGGGWRNNAGHSRSSRRSGCKSDFKNYALGFRLVSLTNEIQ